MQYIQSFKLYRRRTNPYDKTFKAPKPSNNGDAFSQKEKVSNYTPNLVVSHYIYLSRLETIIKKQICLSVLKLGRFKSI